MSAPIDLAIEDCFKQLQPNFSAIARKYGVHRTTLQRRYEGSQLSRRQARELTHNRLTLVQEEVLIGFINDFTEKRMPPTSQIVKNVAEEIAGSKVGKNWVGQFTQRHKDRLHAAYLASIDSNRVKAEYLLVLKRFYDQVCNLYQFHLALHLILV